MADIVILAMIPPGQLNLVGGADYHGDTEARAKPYHCEMRTQCSVHIVDNHAAMGLKPTKQALYPRTVEFSFQKDYPRS